MSDKENRKRLFMDDLRELLWRHKAELSVELDNDGRINFKSVLRVYWDDGTHDELRKSIDGKEPTP